MKRTRREREERKQIEEGRVRVRRFCEVDWLVLNVFVKPRVRCWSSRDGIKCFHSAITFPCAFFFIFYCVCTLVSTRMNGRASYEGPVALVQCTGKRESSVPHQYYNSIVKRG